jgi:hypothetical protein
MSCRARAEPTALNHDTLNPWIAHAAIGHVSIQPLGDDRIVSPHRDDTEAKVLHPVVAELRTV